MKEKLSYEERIELIEMTILLILTTLDCLLKKEVNKDKTNKGE